MNLLTIIVTDGLVYGAQLFLVALGLTLIYGVLRILNMAHGSLYAMGAYMGAWLVNQVLHQGDPVFLSYFLLLGGALIIGLGFGFLIERGLLHYLYGHGEVHLLIITYALFLIFEDLMKLIWGVSPYYTYSAYYFLGTVPIGGIPYPGYSFLIVGIAVLAGIGVWLFLNKTRYGRAVVAVIQDPEISQVLGINVSGVYTLTFIIGATIAALAGGFVAPTRSIVPGISVTVIISSFAVVVIGGLGSLRGAVIGALIVGLARAAAVHIFPQLQVFIIYLVMTLILLFRPRGLFGEREVKRI